MTSLPRPFLYLLLLLLIGSLANAQSARIPAQYTQFPAQHARYIDPLLGASGGGNVFPGPAVPFGMIKPGPDMFRGAGRDANAGWDATAPIRGFSQTHVSGTGGGSRYGNILIAPTTGAITPADHDSPRADERASAGLYSVNLARYNIAVEITAARHSAIYRIHYPAGAPTNLLFDVSHCLISGEKQGEQQILAASRVQILSPTEITGSTSVMNGWNKQPVPYTVYFYAISDTPAASSGTWTSGTSTNDQLTPGGKHASGAANSQTGAWLTFNPRANRTVLLKIGISFISIDQARRNLASEIPGFNFDRVHAAALAAWNRALSTVDIGGATPEQSQTFYTALYHTMLMPTDCTGENPLWHSTEPYYDDYYAIWDIFRTSGPLLTLAAPQRETAIVRALVDLYRHEGWLPDARAGNYNGRTQGGSDADFLLTDAYLKGLKGIDWKSALAAELHGATVQPADRLKEGRGGLNDWLKYGYVSVEDFGKPASVSMEYAADDFEIAVLARGLGDTAAYRKYLASSANWQKLWDSNFTADGFTGFIRPRHRDGSWLSPFTDMEFDSWNGDTFYEGNSWTYSFFVPQNVAALVAKMGGSETFVRRLDAFFAVPGRYDVGNEPGFLTPYLYIWAGRPDKTDEHVRAIIAASFHSGLNGLPGNDDSGAMSSWFAFGQMGIFPNAGQDVYLIGSPAFAQTTLHLAGGRSFIIEAKHLSPQNIYVTSATLNGQPLNRAWLHHREIATGGRLVLTMAATPGEWAQHNPPPSSPPAN